MLTHLFLSPHFDDAIGSCGGTIGRLLGIGHTVRIVTTFGGAEREPFSVPAKVLHDEWKLERPVGHRRLEDASACRVLGCEGSFFEFPDAIYRQDFDGRHVYPTFDSLRGLIAPEDSLLADQLAAQVKRYLSSRNTIVYCPLAIGSHVDHVVVRDCGQILQASGSTVVFYRDFYYDQQLIAEAECAGTTCVKVTLTPEEMVKKCAAFSEYNSQISDLFGTQANMVSYFTGTGKTESLFLSQQADLLPILLGALAPREMPRLCVGSER